MSLVGSSAAVVGSVFVAIAVAGSVACDGADDPGGGDDPAAALAERVSAVVGSSEAGASVVERLAELGVDTTTAALADASITCPSVDAPEAGDGATCVAHVDEVDVQLEVEFGEEGAVAVVGVATTP